MSVWKEILRRAGYLGRRSEFDRELDDEIQFHIDTRAEELENEGVSAEDARERARREFGPRARMTEDTRGAWQFRWLEDLWRDVRYAVRASAQSPGFTAIAVLSLAMGVGANSAMFIFVDAFMLRPLPVPRASEVVTVYETTPQSGSSGVSYLEYVDLRDRSASLDRLTAFAPISMGFASQAGAEPHTKDGQLVAVNYFDVLGVKPELGRTFLPQEDQVPGRDTVVILSHDVWQREFASDPAVLGKHAWIGGIAFTIVGVLPARFSGIDDSLTEDYPEYFTPLMMASRIGPQQGDDADVFEKRDARILTLLGRLRPGVAIPQARAELATIAASLEKQYPETNKNRNMTIQTVVRYRTSGVPGALATMVMTLAGAVLLVACFNVAGLLTSRSAGRSREIAMRLALGAGRARLVRQLLTESLLLALAGGLAGVGIGYIPTLVVKRIVQQIYPEYTGPWPFKLDERVLLFSMAVALLSVVLFGLVPAFQTTRADLSSAMKGAGAVPPRRRRWFFHRLWGRNVLVAAQVAISVLLLTVSSYIYVGIRSFLVVMREQGFQADHVLAVTFDPVVTHYKDARAQQFYKQVLERLRAAAGVKAATLASSSETTAIRPDGYEPPKDAGNDIVAAPVIWAEDNFFDALAIPILQGRGFRGADSAGAPEVAVVNESFAKHYWKDQDPIGKRIRVGENNDRKQRWVQVVGVTAMKSYQGIISVPPPDLLFLPAAQNSKHPLMTLFAQSAGDPTALVGSLRALVREVDPTQAAPEVHNWQYMYEAIDRGARLVTHVIGAMGAMGIVLALVGLYGLVAYDVSSRTREIGIRMALGAARGAVLRMVLRQGLVLSVCGIGAGLLLNYGVGRLLVALIKPDPNPRGGIDIDFGYPTIAMFVLAVLALTMLAAYLPARRAARVDPNEALRCE